MTINEKMRAVVHSRYGPPEELQLKEVDKPVPQPNELLIKIRASTVTSSDCNTRNFTFVPGLFHLPMRMQFGFSTPKNPILGMDLAGDIESTGAQVTRFKVGDAVFGTTEPRFGAHAEYICLPEDAVLALKPVNLSYEEAAAFPVMANTALHFIRTLGQVRSGDSVLINGASGGIGTFAVQLAKLEGAEVTGVCSTRNVELVKSLGADYVIDYTKEDFTRSGRAYDVIFDVAGMSSFSASKKVMKDNGVFLSALPVPEVLFQMLWTSIAGRKKIKTEAAPAIIDNLLTLKALAEAGQLKAVIGRCYPLEQMADAFRYVEQGHKRGNVVITVSDNKAPRRA